VRTTTRTPTQGTIMMKPALAASAALVAVSLTFASGGRAGAQWNSTPFCFNGSTYGYCFGTFADWRNSSNKTDYAGFQVYGYSNPTWSFYAAYNDGAKDN
jgi:hypothetical protein